MPLALALFMETQLIPDLPFGIAEGQWGDPPLPVMIGDSPVLLVALVAVPLYGALLYLLPISPRSHWRLATAIGVPALTLAALEFTRANLDPGGLWGTLSLTQAGSPGGELAAIAGPWALALLIAAVNYAIAFAIARRSILPAILAPACLVAAFGASVPASGEAGDPVRVAAVQPGYDTAEDDLHVLRRWQPGTHDLAALDVIGDLVPMTERAAQAGAELVVWPEATTFADPHEDQTVAGLVDRVALENDVTIVFPHFDYGDSRSAVSLVDHEGYVTPSRPKQRPMWFLGERADAGDPEPLRSSSGLRIGTLLGVDAQDADITAELAGDGAAVIASATHDWEQLATQQLAQAQLLAQAAGIGIVRADWRYGSAIVAPGGEILAEAGGGKHRELVVADVPGAKPTWYSSIGGVFGWFCLAALGLLAASRAAWPSSRSRGPRRA